jgi:hypothetical protein
MKHKVVKKVVQLEGKDDCLCYIHLSFNPTKCIGHNGNCPCRKEMIKVESNIK